MLLWLGVPSSCDAQTTRTEAEAQCSFTPPTNEWGWLDPKQLQNLAGDAQHQELLERMRRRTDQLRDSLGGEYTPEKFPTVRRRQRQQPQPAGGK